MANVKMDVLVVVSKLVESIMLMLEYDCPVGRDVPDLLAREGCMLSPQTIKTKIHV